MPAIDWSTAGIVYSYLGAVEAFIGTFLSLSVLYHSDNCQTDFATYRSVILSKILLYKYYLSETPRRDLVLGLLSSR